MPDFSRIDLETLQGDISHWDNLFSTPAKKIWWDNFITRMIKLRDDPDAAEDYQEPDTLIWQLAHIPKVAARQRVVQRMRGGDAEPLIPADLQQQLDKETQETEVS